MRDAFGNVGEIMIGVSSTGEQIQNDGRVYASDAVSSTSVELPTFTQVEFEEVKGKLVVQLLPLLFCAKIIRTTTCHTVTEAGLELNDQILKELGWVPAGAVPETLEEMVASASYLPSTYHYHGMMCPNTNELAAGFHACDLSRMCRKWSGSTSVASGGMGVQCGIEVAAELDAAGHFD